MAKDIKDYKIGDRVSGYAPGYSDDNVTGEIVFIDPSPETHMHLEVEVLEGVDTVTLWLDDDTVTEAE